MLTRLIRSATFRLAALYAALFAVGALALVAFFDWRLADYARRDTRAELVEEMRLFQDAGQRRGDELHELIQEREHALGPQAFPYALFAPDGRRLRGSLPVSAAHDGFGAVTIPAPPSDHESPRETAEIMTLGAGFPSGERLVIGISTYGAHELEESMVSATVFSALGATLVSFLLAYLIGRQFISRVDRVNAAAGRIMEGRLDERLPPIGMGEEFDRLAANLNAMLDRIQALMEGLRQVSSDIAHDMRTPLTRLRSRLESGLLQAGANPERDALAQEAITQLDEILATFAALLRIAQVEGGTGREAFRQVDLSELTERVRQAYEPVAEDQDQTLAADLEAGVMVSGDEELLTQLISNLIENAFTHAPSGPVEMRVRREGELAVLEIADRGPGVPEAERAQVVRRFYRLDRSRTTPGAGLGLSTVAAIARLHEARLELLDNAPGLRVRVGFPALH